MGLPGFQREETGIAGRGTWQDCRWLSDSEGIRRLAHGRDLPAIHRVQPAF
jgi:hypothetical protein